MGKRNLLIGVALASIAAASADAQTTLERLPRESFDVIAPTERVQGERGAMRVYQAACRIGPSNWARRRIVDVAVQEWAYFGMQTVDATHVEKRMLPPGLVPDALNPELKEPRIVRQYPRLGTLEYDPRMDATIAGYWSATPEGPRAIARQNAAWNGPGGNALYWIEPWSAAFISWVMCEAGLGDMAQFRRSSAHRDYIDQAIRARDGDAPEAAYAAYDAGETPIAPGDLLCNSRAGFDYRSLADRRNNPAMYALTHCDIVVKVEEARVLLIGGNVDQSVSLTILPLMKDGRPNPHPPGRNEIDGARTIFAHLSLRADPVEPSALDSSPTVKALSQTQNSSP
jgi:hypothetical protein